MLPCATFASLRVSGAADWRSHRLTCQYPIQLAYDCSVWQGATRPIAVGRYRMHVAADRDGKTVLVMRLRVRPSHNGGEFAAGADSASNMPTSRDVVEYLGSTLARQGIRLERMREVLGNGRIDGFFLDFSSNAYDYLRGLTVLESEYWMPSPTGTH